VKDFLNKILSIPSERISHPILGPFILSWIAFNWEALAYFFFYDQNMKDKIDYISQRYNNQHYLLVLPIISTFIYKLVLPYVSTGIAYLLRKSADFNSKEKRLHLEKLREQEEEDIKRKVYLEDLQIKLKEQLNNKGEIEGLIKQIEDRDALIQRERDRSEMQSIEHKRSLEFMEKTYISEINTLKSNLALLHNENSALSDSFSKVNEESNALRLKLLEKESKRIKPLSAFEVRNRSNIIKKKNKPNSSFPDEG
jgi:hypothetical protein